VHIDRRSFLATLGTTAAINAMPSEALADALEHRMIESLDEEKTADELNVRLGTGLLFGGPLPSGKTSAELKKLEPMPEKPTLVDFFKYRFAPATAKHVLQSATDAMKKGEKDELILACLLHRTDARGLGSRKPEQTLQQNSLLYSPLARTLTPTTWHIRSGRVVDIVMQSSGITSGSP